MWGFFYCFFKIIFNVFFCYKVCLFLILTTIKTFDELFYFYIIIMFILLKTPVLFLVVLSFILRKIECILHLFDCWLKMFVPQFIDYFVIIWVHWCFLSSNNFRLLLTSSHNNSEHNGKGSLKSQRSIQSWVYILLLIDKYWLKANDHFAWMNLELCSDHPSDVRIDD